MNYLRLIPIMAATSILIACTPTEKREAKIQYDAIGYSGSEIKTFIQRDSAGNKLIEGNFFNGKKNGSWITYNAAGQILDITNYIDDIKQGPYIKLSGTNQIIEQGSYKDNMVHGFILKYLYGKMNEKIEFIDGIRQGIATTYYQTGGKKQEMELRDSIQHGIYRFYGENGELQIEERFEHGKKVSGGIVRK